MKTRSSLFLIGFVIFLMTVGIACNFGATPTPTQQPAPTQPPSALAQPTSNTNNSNSDSTPTAFSDQNKLYTIEIPGDWTHTHNSGANAYIDQFKSPDGNAVVENITYNDGKPFQGTVVSRMALQLLHQFYSSTGKEGDIHISSDKIMPDGSERISWTSSGRGFSGQSYFKVQDRLNFMMFTVEWANDHQSQYADVLNKIYASYKSP